MVLDRLVKGTHVKETRDGELQRDGNDESQCKYNIVGWQKWACCDDTEGVTFTRGQDIACYRDDYRSKTRWRGRYHDGRARKGIHCGVLELVTGSEMGSWRKLAIGCGCDWVRGACEELEKKISQEGTERNGVIAIGKAVKASRWASRFKKQATTTDDGVGGWAALFKELLLLRGLVSGF